MAYLAQDADLSLSTILVVDDHPNNLEIAVKLLSKLGANVITARSGQRGLKRAAYAQPDLILLDILMPEIDGFEVCRRLKTNPTTREIPIVFMTALADMEMKIRGLQAGGIDYITKPFQAEELMARVANHLRTQKCIQKLQRHNQQLQKLLNSSASLPEPESVSPILQQVLDYIHAHLTENITLKEIAAQLGMSQSYFCRWFKQLVGISPYQYVLQQRVEQAKQLLQDPNIKLVDVALQCGFNSQSHLIHHFKRQTDTTPGAYQQQLAALQNPPFPLEP